MTVRLFLFGSPAVDYGGESLALPFERRNQLVAFLALKRSWVGRAELAALLWPEQENKLAYANLRKTLHRLQSLPWARGIESQGGALRFEAETDVAGFDSPCASSVSPMRCRSAAANFSQGLTTVRVKLGRAGSTSSGTACDSRGAMPPLTA